MKPETHLLIALKIRYISYLSFVLSLLIKT